jgi:hypothetical protein
LTGRRGSGGETTGGKAGAAAQRRRVAAQPLNGAGAHLLLRILHQNDGKRLANPLATFPGGDGEG